MNLREQVELLFDNYASGFLSTEACAQRSIATHFGLMHWLNQHSTHHKQHRAPKEDLKRNRTPQQGE